MGDDVIPEEDCFDAKFIGEYIPARRAATKGGQLFPKSLRVIRITLVKDHPVTGVGYCQSHIRTKSSGSIILRSKFFIATGQIGIAIEEKDVRKYRSERFDEGERVLFIIAAEIMSWRDRDN